MSDEEKLHLVDWGGLILPPTHSIVSITDGVIQKVPNYYASFIDIARDENYIGDELNFLINRSNNLSIDTQVSHILGRFAEALLVKSCNENEEINRFFANTAREGNLSHPFPKHFTAVGTGTRYTANHSIFKIHSQPHDRQVDVIWVRKNDVKKLLQHPYPNVGIAAGLQLKTGSNWRSVIDKITQYWHPVVYFDLDNDWHMLNGYINAQKQQYHWNPSSYWHQVKLVCPHDIIDDIKKELRWFRNCLYGLLNNQISIRYLIDMANAEQMLEVGHAITGYSGNSQVLITETALAESYREDDDDYMRNIIARVREMVGQNFK